MVEHLLDFEQIEALRSEVTTEAARGTWGGAGRLGVSSKPFFMASFRAFLESRAFLFFRILEMFGASHMKAKRPKKWSKQERAKTRNEVATTRATTRVTLQRMKHWRLLDDRWMDQEVMSCDYKTWPVDLKAESLACGFGGETALGKTQKRGVARVSTVTV